MSDVSDRLSKLPTIQHLASATLDELARLGKVVRIPDGWTPIHQQEPADKAYIVLDGTLSVIRDEKTVAEIGPGGLAGEMGLVDHRLRNAQLTATAPVHVLAWPRKVFQALREQHPDFDRLVRESTQTRHSENEARD